MSSSNEQVKKSFLSLHIHHLNSYCGSREQDYRPRLYLPREDYCELDIITQTSLTQLIGPQFHVIMGLLGIDDEFLQSHHSTWHSIQKFEKAREIIRKF